MASETLSNRRCTPCQGGIPPLEPAAAAWYLEQIPEWELTDGGTWIRRNFTFPDFQTALVFVQQIAELAGAEDHHPVLTFGWGFCIVALQTMKIRGLHVNDFIVAAKIDELFRRDNRSC